MTILTGINALIEGRGDVKVLAEIISTIHYELLVESHPTKSPTITQDEFDLFIARNGRNMIDAGLLDDELNVTGEFKSPINY